MEKTLIKTADLGFDWFANQWSDGSMTLRNSAKGQRIDLPAESVERLRTIFAQIDTEKAA